LGGDRGARSGTTYISQQLPLEPARFQRIPGSIGGHGLHNGRSALPVVDGEVGKFDCHSPSRVDRQIWRERRGVSRGKQGPTRTGKAVGLRVNKECCSVHHSFMLFRSY
jgi:hypothetical protein